MSRTRPTTEESPFELLLPDHQIRRHCLELLLQSIRTAHHQGRNKWGVHRDGSRVRLLVGGLVVFTIENGRIWLALDGALLDASPQKRATLDRSPAWQWDAGKYAEYRRVPSKNGYYMPHPKRWELRPVIDKLHLEFVRNVARKYEHLPRPSQERHMPAILDSLSDVLECEVPRPDFGDDPNAVERVGTAQEIPDDAAYFEGARCRVTVNAYERDPNARSACIEHYGTSCTVCGFSFGRVYGPAGDGFIHVHHLKPLSDVGERYQVDPIEDLRPVCPNCHEMIHRRTPPYSLEEVKRFIRQASRRGR